MQALPGRRCPDRIDDDAKSPEDSFVPPACARRSDDTDARKATVRRFGPTTPKRARRLADASVDHTEARYRTTKLSRRRG